MENNQTHPKPSNYLVLAIISTVFCCLIPGIVSIVNAAKVNEAYALGNYEQAERASKNAKTWAIVGIAIAGLFWLIYIAFFGLAIFGAFMGAGDF
ncbi:CD225/dispanin family protein [Arenibacter sp. ARW7G5Y1]|uniref:CD225/dispanin family protein n=1 Tax=Arenibacter sp. ARW7G5Y1 TaxID=2135619 RepID=UPI000D76EBCA|nr:CD225/dispanin family protein [Arenibacter sp. ARW7G5Y1]PXX23036.1 interferon-induced transmembrane protein [Arenibacter sp. ARW7G5Y1]|tara:strand:+ start:706 stop:990 length:285 start_codon:yes stop_codon:yes gene_type:complete